jgi:H+-transporting ATPase
VLGVSTVLGVLGVIAAFGLFYLGERVLHLDRAHIQTMMYLKLSVAGHLTIFLTRTRGPFWSIRPARILWVAVLGTQVLATCIAIFGFGLVTPLEWYWALLVWGWGLAWFLLNDRAKLLTYWLLDRVRAEEAATVVGVEPAAHTQKIAPAAAAGAPAVRVHSASPVPDQPPGMDTGKIAASRDSKLGEVLLAAVRRDPAGAGHFEVDLKRPSTVDGG